MKKFFIICLNFVISIACFASTKLWYDKPATDWVEALPLGNGKQGAMVYSGVQLDEIQLSENTFWAGSPHNNNKEGASKHFDKLKQLMISGDVKTAFDLLAEQFDTPINGMPYQPIGSLMLRFDNQEDIKDFSRQLDISKALVTSNYQNNNTKITKEYFTSFTDKILIININAQGDEKLNFDAYYRGPASYYPDKNTAKRTKKPQKDTKPAPIDSKPTKGGDYPYQLSFDDDKMIMTTTSKSHETIEGKVKACTITKIITDGNVSNDGYSLKVSDAKNATIYLAISTNFENYNDISGDEIKKSNLLIENAIKNDYNKAKQEHIAYYKNQFDRLSLTLPENENSKLPTDKRVEKFKTEYDADLIALLFQYGRYLLISSSQNDGQPSTLQGIWVDTTIPAWDSKHTLNINQQMNYWLTNPTDLPEVFMPMVKMYKQLSQTGQETAKTVYGADGWVVHHNTDIWRVTGMIDKPYHGTWVSGGMWLTSNIWQHYLYTGDKLYLEDVYPAMKGVADFYMSFAIEHPKYGWLVTPVSNSPENAPKIQKGVSISMGPAMDNQLAFDTLNTVKDASIILNKDKEYIAKLDDAISKLAPIQVGRYGQIQEWLDDIDTPNDTHRHMSHLYAFHPSNQISPYTTPELFEATKVSLNMKGDGATGWSIAWKINLWARALDGNRANKIIKNLVDCITEDNLDGKIYPNLFFTCPPFQIDASYGLTSAIAEMILQSQDGAVHLLPALPSDWQYGNVNGMLARGGFKVDMQWTNNNLTKATIYSRLGGNLRLRSYVPLKGEGLVEAVGQNPNEFYTKHDIPTPKISDKVKFEKANLKKIYQYDIMTQKGQSYIVEAK